MSSNRPGAFVVLGLVSCLCVALYVGMTRAADAQATAVAVHAFAGYPSDGAYPTGSLVADASGNLYGATQEGGTVSGCVNRSGQPQGCGTVFALMATKDGYAERILRSFAGGRDGLYPLGSLLLDRDGNLYGVTREGGVSCNGFGCGTIFKLERSGSHYIKKILHFFVGCARRGNCHPTNDGVEPSAGLEADENGMLYGVAGGGAFGQGVVYKIAPDGSGYSVLYAFRGGSDGAGPSARLTVDHSGAIFGTTVSGGAPCSCGTAFELTPNGVRYSESLLYRFQGPTNGDGIAPSSPLLIAYGGLWGETASGGSGGGSQCFYISLGYDGCGIVFKLVPSRTGWAEHVMHHFDFFDGLTPVGGLTEAQNGQLYGVTESAYPSGNVFSLSPAGGRRSFDVVYAFGEKQLYGPAGPLLDVKGTFYGVSGGLNASCYCGAVYALRP